MNSKNKKLLSKMKDEKKQTSLTKLKKRKNKELILIVMLFIFVIGFVIFMFSPYVKLKNIEVQGYNNISKEEILQAGEINTSLKTWSIKDEDIKRKIKEKFNILKNVEVKSKMLSSIKISVEEYKLIAQNKLEDGSYQIIMENGEAYNGKFDKDYTLPILENFKDINKQKNIYKNLSELKDEILKQISEIVNAEDDIITIYMKDGQKIKALSSSFYEKLNYYDSISSHISDKQKTVLNLINGAYLETEKTDKEKTRKINSLLGITPSDNPVNNNTSEEKDKKETTRQTQEQNQTQNITTTQKKKYRP